LSPEWRVELTDHSLEAPTDRPSPPSATAAVLVRKWWILAIGGIVGGLLGLLLGGLRQPIYQAASVLAVNVDYGRTKPLELVVEDRALDRVWALVLSDAVLEATRTRLVESVGEAPDWATLADLRQHIRLDNRLSRWELFGISSTPAHAAAIANAWADVSYQTLVDAQSHAWQAITLQGEAFLVACAQTIPGQAAQVLWECVASQPGVRPEDVAALRAEIDASHGILPILTFERIQAATEPDDPTLWGRGGLVLSGALTGMLVALAILAIAVSRGWGSGGTPSASPQNG